MAKTQAVTLDWLRAKRDETELSKRRTWESKCRRYKVQECVGKFTDMGTYFYALTGPTLISRHRKKGAAERACEKHLRTPVKRKRRVTTAQIVAMLHEIIEELDDDLASAILGTDAEAEHMDILIPIVKEQLS